MSHTHYNIHQKRAAVAVYQAAKDFRKEEDRNSIDPIFIASVAAGGASRRQIFQWLKQDLSDEALDIREETRGRPSVLAEDQENLLVGFAASSRSSLESVSLQMLRQFCKSYLNVTLSNSTLSRIMTEHGFSSQKALTRNSRMTSEEVVDEALEAIEEIRSYNFPPHRIICMDETGLWSNVTKPKPYHFKNWCDILRRLLTRRSERREFG
jgi:transposase